MSVIKEVYSKIKGIQNIRKITKAIEMVSISKMRKALEQMENRKFYLETVRKIVNNIILINVNSIKYDHIFLQKRKVKTVGYLVISTDRGLCGSLNINLFKKLLKDMERQIKNGAKIKLVLIGSKAISFFNSINVQIIAQKSEIEENSFITNVMSLIKILIKKYEYKKLDKLYIVFNNFISTFIQVPKIVQLLPLISNENKKNKTKFLDYLYEPSSKEILDILFHSYIESQIFYSISENFVSEQASRMLSMKSSTENAKNLIEGLQSIYNKIRQSKITQEIAEIVSGSDAVI